MFAVQSDIIQEGRFPPKIHFDQNWWNSLLYWYCYLYIIKSLKGPFILILLTFPSLSTTGRLDRVLSTIISGSYYLGISKYNVDSECPLSLAIIPSNSSSFSSARTWRVRTSPRPSERRSSMIKMVWLLLVRNEEKLDLPRLK